MLIFHDCAEALISVTHLLYRAKFRFIFFVLRLNVQVNSFSVMSGRSQRFLGLTSTVESKCVLLKDTTRRRLWGSNPEA